jgi:hypothetical protein
MERLRLKEWQSNKFSLSKNIQIYWIDQRYKIASKKCQCTKDKTNFGLKQTLDGLINCSKS